MDTETLRKQIYDEINAQFEAKLRDVKKQKSHVEEELESSSEKWRSERRRLNGEIDRLESALADARNERRKVAGAKAATSLDAPSVAQPKVGDDEKVKKATHEWESERARLENEISRLQGGLAEMLERANNPLRAGQAAREQLELRLEEALRMKRQAEDSLIGAREEWDREKLKLAGEMIRLRRSVGTARTSKEGSPEEDAQAAEIRRLTAQLAGAREAAAKETAAEIERERRGTNATREGLERDLQTARKEITLLKEAQSAGLERQTAHLEEFTRAQARIRDLEERVAEAGNEQLETQLEEASRRHEALEAQLAGIREAAAREYAEQIERERRDSGHERERLNRDLQYAQKEIALLKGAQTADLERQAAQLEESQKAYAKIRDLERRMAEAGKGQTDQLEKQLAEAKKAQQDALHLKEAQAEELLRLTARLDEAQTEIQHLGRQLEETQDRVSTEVVEQLRRQYDERMQEVIGQKTQLSEQFNNASSLLEAERNRFTAIAAQTNKEPFEGPASGMTIDTAAMDAELTRTEARIADIVRLIDDPSTELSTVIRKNVERAELDAYLKGILFSMGRGHGL